MCSGGSTVREQHGNCSEMKSAVFLLLVAVVLLPNAQGGWWRRRVKPFLGNVWNGIKPSVVPAIVDAFKNGKRAVEAHDVDKDGFIDMSEAKLVFEARDAEDIMSLISEDGNSKVSLAQWEEGLENILDMAARDADMFEDAE